MYNKLFSKILDSSIWLEPLAVRVVWITLLAAMDEDGYAHFSAVTNLSRRANVSERDAQKAVDILLSPDPHSGDPEFDGRRIERVPGGFFILNAKKHRDLYNREIQREQTRIRVARHRQNKQGNADSVTNALHLDVASADEESAFAKMIVWTKDKGWRGVTDKDKAEWKDAYPACDIDRQLRAMEQWCKSNGAKAKKSNWRKFITNWLARQQDRGGDMRNGNRSSTTGAQRKAARSNGEYASNVDRDKIVR